MATETSAEDSVYHITLRGPNDEEEAFLIRSQESAAVLKQRISSSTKFTIYTCYHFEVENMKGGENLILGAYTPFKDIPVVGEGCTILLVQDLYDTNTIRFQIKNSVALLSNKRPLISQLIQFNNGESESLKKFTTIYEELKKSKGEVPESTPSLDDHIDPMDVKNDITYMPSVSNVSMNMDGSDLASFTRLHRLLNDSTPVAIRSLSVSTYNPPKPNRRAVGDLIYLRAYTVENNVIHITGSADGFFANKSTDSAFDASSNVNYSNIYPTLPAILCAISSGFKKWYNQHRQVARSGKLDYIVRSFPLPTNMKATSGSWFDAAEDEEKEPGNLFNYANEILDDALSIPFLTSEENLNWVNNYNVIRDSPIEESMKHSLLLAKEQSFASAATKAVVTIVDEGVPTSFNEGNDTCYVINDIFIVWANKSNAEVVTSANCNEEVSVTRIINGLAIPNLYTSLVAVVDYKGHRFLCQGIIPGVMQSPTNLIMYGSIDDGHSIYHDERILPFIKKIAENMYWKESKVHPIAKADPFVAPASFIPATPASTTCFTDPEQENAFLGPVEGRVVRATDNRLYADMLHCTPIDIYWIEEHEKLGLKTSCGFPVVRRSLVIQHMYQRGMAVARIDEIKSILEKLEKGEEIKDFENTEENRKTLQDSLAALEEQVKTMATSFDVNAFTQYSTKGCEGEKDVRALCDMMIHSIIPTLKSAIAENVEEYMDGDKLCQTLNSGGVSKRYLGALASICKEEEEEIRLLCECEMIARSSKHVLGQYLRNKTLLSAPAYATTAFLNGVLNKDRKHNVFMSKDKTVKIPNAISQAIVREGMSSKRIWNAIMEDVKVSYHYDLQIWGKKPITNECRLNELRRICNQCGIRLVAKKYDVSQDYIVTIADIMEYTPHVKFAITPTMDELVSDQYQSILTFIENGQLENAYLLCKQLLMDVIRAHSQLHPLFLSILSRMASILYSVHDLTNAIDVFRACIYCSDCIYGKDSLESAKLHYQLAGILFSSYCCNEAILHYLITMQIYRFVFGNDCEQAKGVMGSIVACYQRMNMNDKALEVAILASEMKDKESNDYLTCCYYACLAASMKRGTNAYSKWRQCYEEIYAKKTEEEKKNALEALDAKIKELKEKK